MKKLLLSIVSIAYSLTAHGQIIKNTSEDETLGFVTQINEEITVTSSGQFRRALGEDFEEDDLSTCEECIVNFIQNPNDSEPNDDANGEWYQYSFNQVVEILEITLIDMDEGNTVIELSGADEVLFINPPQMGDGVIFSIDVNHQADVVRMNINGSGGDLNVKYRLLDVTLPVELIRFEIEDGIITWETASEYNNDYFEVLWSKDQQNWISIGKIDGRNEAHIYQMFAKDTEGHNFHVLKQVDYDGSETYSNVIDYFVAPLVKSKGKVYTISGQYLGDLDEIDVESLNAGFYIIDGETRAVWP